jgi:FkbM family methyltransferase
MISDLVKNNQVWERHMHLIIEQFVNSDSVVVECGCHIGTHTVKLAMLCKTLYGFEPMPSTYEVLLKNLQVNKITNATIFNEGVSDTIGETKYSWICDGNPGSSGLENNPMGKPSWIQTTTQDIPVQLRTIDSLQLPTLDFLKIDVEGYEVLAIQGAMDTIKRCRPVIVMEVWKDHQGSVDKEYTVQTFSHLIELGYDVLHIEGPDFLFIPRE